MQLNCFDSICELNQITYQTIELIEMEILCSILQFEPSWQELREIQTFRHATEGRMHSSALCGLASEVITMVG